MDKRNIALVGGIAFLAVCGGFAISEAPARIASANGTFEIEGNHDDDEGIGFVNFTLEERRGRVRGTLVFGSEHHHGAMYPDVTAKMDSIRSARFDSNTVEFEGRGELLLQPVSIKARAYDGDDDNLPDFFAIRIVDNSGDVLFEAEGELYIGDISIGE